MELEDYLAVPYILVSYSAPDANGIWQRFVKYPELGCVAHADTAVEAVVLAEKARAQTIADLLARGEEVPVPRQPLPTLRYEARRLHTYLTASNSST